MAIKELQAKIGATPDGVFGRQTMLKSAAYWKISKEQAANFFGQLSHETGGFKAFSENLNYSADRLLVVFPKYFKSKTTAYNYAKKPEAIANRVYGGRMGNGDEKSGDGWKFRGRGAIQLTGRDNYQAFSDFMGDKDIINKPDIVATKYAFDSAIFYFTRNNIWSPAKSVSAESNLIITKKINGGVNGIKDRLAHVQKYYSLIS
jgi:putative chitinase